MSNNTNIADEEIAEIKEIRVAQQGINDRINDLAILRPVYGAELTLAKRAGQTVRHWLGESLGVIREHRVDLQHPYPDADNSATPAIAPTADIK
jgi:hypothetical protein